MKVLISVKNISGYLVAGLRELVKVAEVAILNEPITDVLHKDDELHSLVKWYNQKEFDTVDKLLKEMDGWTPDIYLCGGWAFPIYLKLNNVLRKKGCTTVLLADTAWQGKFRQLMNVLFGRFYFPYKFNYAWGAGPPQAKYFRLLGFQKDCVFQGMYCADVNKFATIASQRIRPWPHNFIYIGRYVPEKNIHRMEMAFLKAIGQKPDSDWNLICIGRGALWEKRTVHPRIQHLGFKSPYEIQDFVKNAGCFVLPSLYEPWGVVVQEGASMGLPLLCSSRVNARLRYLKEGVNGFVFNPTDIDDIARVFLSIMNLTDEELDEMGNNSYNIGMSYTPQMWASTIMSFVK